MAAILSTTSTLTIDEAFKQPLPAVRQFHKQLNTAVEEKNARLRSLVGGGYRQLLGTAEMIVDMRKDIEAVEQNLGDVAAGCGKNAVGQKLAGLRRLGVRDRGDEVLNGNSLGWIARMQVILDCNMIAGRLIKGKAVSSDRQQKSRGQDLVTVAKIMVLSRLLLKSVGDESAEEDSSRDLVDEARKSIGGHRRRLLRSIDRVLQTSDGDRDDLMQALCAYSLATNSGSRDVLRHFLHVRGEALALIFDSGETVSHSNGKEDETMMKALRLYISTLLDVQALMPRRLSNELLRIKAQPLLKHEELRQLEILRLDVHERWFGDEVAFFTPYIRHDDLQGSQAVEMLEKWAERATELLIQGFIAVVDRVMNLKSLAHIRTQVFETWIREGSRVKGFDSSSMLDSLRDVINGRTVALIESRISKLHLVGAEIEAIICSWSKDEEVSMNPWNSDLLNMDLGNGAADVKSGIISYVLGRSASVSRVCKSYEAWKHLATELSAVVEKLKKQRWDEDLETLDEDDAGEDRNAALAKADPAMMEACMSASLDIAFKDLDFKIATLHNKYQTSAINSGIAVFLLRIIREIRADLLEHKEIQTFGLTLIPKLHQDLASHTGGEPVTQLAGSFSRTKKLPWKVLWEESPEMPVQPSPAIFKFFRTLMSSMSAVGTDVWSAAAVKEFKKHLDGVLGDELSSAIDARDQHLLESSSNLQDEQDSDSRPSLMTSDADSSNERDPAPVESAEESILGKPDSREEKLLQQDIFVQWLFDILVLKQVLTSNSRSDTGLASLETAIKARISEIEVPEKRLRRSAEDWWKRTSLLFGLLL